MTGTIIPMDRQGLLRREEGSWAAFASAFAAVAPDRLDHEGVVPGWSTKDLVWHCAYWARFCAEALEATSADAAWTDPFAGQTDEDWDGENARIAEESKAMSWDGILSETGRVRQRVRAALSAAPDRDELAEWFAEETFTHYDEHAEEIRRFIGT